MNLDWDRDNGYDDEGDNYKSSRPNSNRTNSNGGSSKRDSSNSSGIYSDLTDRLRNLSFPAFQTLIFLWLGAKGYRDICILKRTGARGRREIGGADFTATSPYYPHVEV